MLELFRTSSIHNIRHFSEIFSIFTDSLIFNSAQKLWEVPFCLSLISLSLIRRKSLCHVKVWVLSVPASFPALLFFQFPTAKSLTYWLESLALKQNDLGFSTSAILASLKQQLSHSSDDKIPTFEVPSFMCPQFADTGFILVSVPSFNPVSTS